MWGVTPSNRWDWASLKAKIAIHGLRNSLLVAPMPTASTAQILVRTHSTYTYIHHSIAYCCPLHILQQARLQQASMRTCYGRSQLVLSANYCLVYCVLAVSTHTLQGNNESIEPFTSNMYNRRVLAGEFAVINKYLLKDLTDMGLWTAEVRAALCITTFNTITNLREC
jgi:ribonucleotide reductase alpha subunit